MRERIIDLVDLISQKHPEILTYYELSNHTHDLDVECLVRAYDLDERYNTGFKTAVRATYLFLKRTTKKKETIERLQREYEEKISKM
ncbi:MAG: hypothetical protein ACP5NS_03540 [Candidatus Pacearchaeota archaeon]